MRVQNDPIPVFTAAIKKALANGWQCELPDSIKLKNGKAKEAVTIACFYPYPELIIFNHDFAKALWGEEHSKSLPDNCGECHKPQFGWQDHLQQTVIADDPIKYLGENI